MVALWTSFPHPPGGRRPPVLIVHPSQPPPQGVKAQANNTICHAVTISTAKLSSPAPTPGRLRRTARGRLCAELTYSTTRAFLPFKVFTRKLSRLQQWRWSIPNLGSEFDDTLRRGTFTRDSARRWPRISAPGASEGFHSSSVAIAIAIDRGSFRRDGYYYYLKAPSGIRHAMAMMCGWKECRGVVCLLLMWSSFVSGSHGVMVENSFVVSRHAGEESVRIVGHDAVPCGSSATTEIRPEAHLLQKVASVASVDDTGPCVRRTTESCPVKCFRADPVCGTDKVTYWCGAADANCAGVEVAHDGYCNLWEMDTNIGSTTALHAVQSLQLVHMLWLVVAGLFIVLGLL